MNLTFVKFPQGLLDILNAIFPYIAVVVIGFSVRNQNPTFVFRRSLIQSSPGMAQSGTGAGISLRLHRPDSLPAHFPAFFKLLESKVGGIIPGFGIK